MSLSAITINSSKRLRHKVPGKQALEIPDEQGKHEVETMGSPEFGILHRLPLEGNSTGVAPMFLRFLSAVKKIPD